jgi:hypothetical protein
MRKAGANSIIAFHRDVKSYPSVYISQKEKRKAALFCQEFPVKEVNRQLLE